MVSFYSINCLKLGAVEYFVSVAVTKRNIWLCDMKMDLANFCRGYKGQKRFFGVILVGTEHVLYDPIYRFFGVFLQGPKWLL